MFLIVLASICCIIFVLLSLRGRNKCLHFHRHTLTSWHVTSASHINTTYYTLTPTLLLFLEDREILYKAQRMKHWLLGCRWHYSLGERQITRGASRCCCVEISIQTITFYWYWDDRLWTSYLFTSCCFRQKGYVSGVGDRQVDYWSAQS